VNHQNAKRRDSSLNESRFLADSEGMDQLDLPRAIADGIHSYLVGDELLLFSEHHRALFRLNPSAALIWFCCEEGLNRQAIIAELRRLFNLPAARAEKDVDATLTEWETRGLLGEANESLTAVDEEHNAEATARELPTPTSVVDDYPRERRYQILDTVFRVRFSAPELEALAQSVFAHLSTSARQPFHLTFDVQLGEQGYFLFRNGSLVAHCASELELAPLLHGQALFNAYSRADCLTAIHAAAISNGDACIVLPANSGSGKSTLTAALVASGYQYCTDELVLLKQHTHSIQAAATAIGIKSGAWPVLQSFYPALEGLPICLRQDAKQVRYLLPPGDLLPDDTAQFHAVHSLVFPRYRPASGTHLRQISPADALCRLAEAGYDVNGGLSAERVTELVNWITAVRCYQLQFHDLHEAVARIGALMK
jgi:hypothetical protein